MKAFLIHIGYTALSIAIIGAVAGLLGVWTWVFQPYNKATGTAVS